MSGTRDKLSRLTAWRRALDRSRELTPRMRWTTIVVFLLVMVVSTANSVLPQGDWGPSAISLAAVGVLFACAATLARRERSVRPPSSRALVSWLDLCPSWFGDLVVVLTLVGLGAGLYLFLQSLGDWSFALAYHSTWDWPLLGFASGGIALMYMLPTRPLRFRRDRG